MQSLETKFVCSYHLDTNLSHDQLQYGGQLSVQLLGKGMDEHRGLIQSMGDFYFRHHMEAVSGPTDLLSSGYQVGLRLTADLCAGLLLKVNKGCSKRFYSITVFFDR